jgi:hypothetical protein
MIQLAYRTSVVLLRWLFLPKIIYRMAPEVSFTSNLKLESRHMASRLLVRHKTQPKKKKYFDPKTITCYLVQSMYVYGIIRASCILVVTNLGRTTSSHVCIISFFMLLELHHMFTSIVKLTLNRKWNLLFEFIMESNSYNFITI